MPSFAYEVKDRAGKSSQGTMDAGNMGEVAGRLRQDGFYIVKLNPVGRTITSSTVSKSGSQGDITRGRVPLKDKMIFTKQFHVMIKAGIGMLACLNNLSEQCENKYLKYVINSIRREVESGVALSVAMSKFPKVFDRMFIHMLEAGEASGKLDLCLSRLNQYMERDYELRKKISGAMVYPAIISFVAVVVVIILMVVVLPTFAQIFKDGGVELPLLTRVLLAIASGIQRFWYILAALPIIFVIGYKRLKSNPKGAELIDRTFLKVPGAGGLIRKIIASRFSRTFATLLDSGVPLLQGLDITEKVVNNAVFAHSIRAASISVNQGTGLAIPLGESDIFPKMVSQMVAIGEETGTISHMFDEIADYYDKEVGHGIEKMTSMIEPLVIVVLGGVVAFIVSAIMIPLFDISSGATLK